MVVAACRHVLREPVHRGPAEAGDRNIVDVERMNVWLLTNLITKRLVIEVDWVEGCEPAPIALEALDKIAREYCPLEIRIIKDDVIPRKKWEEALSRGEGRTALAREFLDSVPDDSSGTEVVYIIYSPRDDVKANRLGHFGVTQWLGFERDGRLVYIPSISIFKEPLAKTAILWITAARCDRSTLVHEFGHVLGLVSNPRHEQRDNPGHCAYPDCAMTYARWRSILYNFLPGFFAARIPSEYCRNCRTDIMRAKTLWETRAKSDPSFIATLRERREADRLRFEASVASNKGARDTAIAYLKEAIMRTPSRPELRSEMGRILLEGGRTEEALASYREAVRLDPSDQERNRYDIAGILCARGRYQEALDSLDRRRLRADRDGSLGYFVLSRALEALRRWREADASLAEFISERNTRTYQRGAAIQWRVRLNRQMGRRDEAARIARRVPKNYRAFSTWRIEMARLAFVRGRAQEGRRLLLEIAAQARGALSRNPSASSAYDRAIALALLQDKEGASEALAELDESYKATSRENTPSWAAMAHAQVFAILGEKEQGLDALVRRTPRGFEWTDPCLDEDLAVLRGEVRFQELFPWCVAVPPPR